MADNFKKIRKAVIPAAGFGTRFLPATKAQPKEMLPIVDKPIIQYVVENAVASGIEQIIIVTGAHKRSIEDHFDRQFELEQRLKDSGKNEELSEIKRISDLAEFVYIRQKEPLGNGHAVLVAKKIIGEEAFAVLWGDEFIDASPPALKQLIDAYIKTGNPVIAGVRVEKEDLSKYGIAKVLQIKDNLYQLEGLVEKPTAGEAPSNLAAHCNYILPPEIFEILEELAPSKAGEIWLPDAIAKLTETMTVNVLEIQNAKYFDCGSKLGYLKAVVEFGLRHQGLNGEFRQYLKSLSL